MIWTEFEAPFAIVGMGASGEAALQLLLAGGVSAEKIKTFDSQASKAEFFDPQKLLDQVKPKTLVVSPGVPLSLPWIKTFPGKITSEISLSLSAMTTEKIIGVTGSVGKSTTVSLLGEALKSFSPSSFVGGNLGTPLAVYATGLLNQKIPRAEWVVLELSSYQLENCHRLACAFSAITYFTPNHLERYPDIKEYYKSKSHLADITTQNCFINFCSSELISFFNTEKNPRLIWSKPEDPKLEKYKFSDSLLLGVHNQQNLALAAHIALAAGWPDSSLEAMKKFKGLPHRLENLGLRNNILYVNDSKATTIESVKTAVSSLLPQLQSGVVYLLCGGKDKNLPWQELAELKNNSQVHVLFFGDVGPRARTASGLTGDIFPKLGPAVARARELARPGDFVLLSPGGTSLDEFQNFEERGNYFKSLVLGFDA